LKRVSKSKNETWAIAQNGWLPLSKAIFHFAGIESGGSIPTEGRQTALSEKLARISREANAKISWNDQQFCFAYSEGPPIHRHPWRILSFITPTAPPPPGHPPVSDYESFLQRVLYGTVSVWEDDMLAPFNQAASAGSILLFGRIEKMASAFVRLPPDIWTQVEVHDWENGNARQADGTDIWSIHAVMSVPNPRSRGGRKPFYDQEQINKKVVRILKEKGRPTASGDANWQAKADLEREVAAFCKKVMGREPSKSATQEFVRRALDYCTSRGL
jgi:hypothetical protein